MAVLEKPPSPFYTGKPLPPALFVGRQEQYEVIMHHGASAVAQGKPIAMFIQGVFGIGKTSLAHLAQRSALAQFSLHPVRASLAGCKDLDDVASAILQNALDTNVLEPRGAEAITNWLGKHFIKTNLFGLAEVDLKALKDQMPDLGNAQGMLKFLKEYWKRLQGAGFRGIFLLLDELNGITANEHFAHFIKGLVDSNRDDEPVPLLLMLAGTPERRAEMIAKHEPVNRIFKVLDVVTLSDLEVELFYRKAFNGVNLAAHDDAISTLVRYAKGVPIVVQELGDAAYYANSDETIDIEDVIRGAIRASEEIGAKFVGPQVLDVIKSEVYHSILMKIGSFGMDDATISRSELANKLTAAEKKNLDNFLGRMKTLNAIRPTAKSGEYVFTLPMVQSYLWLRWFRKDLDERRMRGAPTNALIRRKDQQSE